MVWGGANQLPRRLQPGSFHNAPVCVILFLLSISFHSYSLSHSFFEYKGCCSGFHGVYTYKVDADDTTLREILVTHYHNHHGVLFFTYTALVMAIGLTLISDIGKITMSYLSDLYPQNCLSF